MALTDAKVKAATVPTGKKQVKLSDGGGLQLLVKPSGKAWKLAYRYNGKQLTLSLGSYPTVSLKDARAKREDAKTALAQGHDPRFVKKSIRATFKQVMIEWLKTRSWTDSTRHANTRRLEMYITPKMGERPIEDIQPNEILTILKNIQSLETAHKCKRLCSQIFRFAIGSSDIPVTSDPCRDLTGLLEPYKPKHFAAITEPKAAGELMRAISAFEGSFIVQQALRLSPYIFTRPGELRHAEWSEIDLDNALWRLPAAKMKAGKEHIIPLSSQSIAILRDTYEFTGRSKYVFHSIRNTFDPMSENTINVALRRLGYDKKEMCAHGFRTMASTLLHELGWNSDVIERQLAHEEGNATKAAYSRGRHLPERIKLMQAWADYLDSLRDNSNIIPINRNTA